MNMNAEVKGHDRGDSKNIWNFYLEKHKCYQSNQNTDKSGDSNDKRIGKNGA